MSKEIAHINQLITWIYYLHVVKQAPVMIIFSTEPDAIIHQGIYQCEFLTEAEKQAYITVVDQTIDDYAKRLDKIDKDTPNAKKFQHINKIDEVLRLRDGFSNLLNMGIMKHNLSSVLKRKRNIIHNIVSLNKDKNFQDMHKYFFVIGNSYATRLIYMLEYLQRCILPTQLNITSIISGVTFTKYLTRASIHFSGLDIRNAPLPEEYIISEMSVEQKDIEFIPADEDSMSDTDRPQSSGLASDKIMHDVENQENSRPLATEISTKILELDQIKEIYDQLYELKRSSITPSTPAWRQIKQRLLDSLFMECLLPRSMQRQDVIITQLAILQRVQQFLKLRCALFNVGPTESFTSACELMMGNSVLMNEDYQLYPSILHCIFVSLRRVPYKDWTDFITSTVRNLKYDIHTSLDSSCISDDEEPDRPRI